MKKKLTLSTIVFIVISMNSFAQKANDSGAWLNLQVNKGWEKAYAMARFEHRSNNNFGSTECMFVMAGGGYKFTPWLKADLSYEHWKINPDITQNKLVLSTIGTLSRSGLSAQIREKLEYTFESSGKAAWNLRSRIRVQYAFENSIFRPYIMSEVFNWNVWRRTLHYAGVELYVSKHSIFDVFYMYHLPNGGPAVHTLGLGYYLNL